MHIFWITHWQHPWESQDSIADQRELQRHFSTELPYESPISALRHHPWIYGKMLVVVQNMIELVQNKEKWRQFSLFIITETKFTTLLLHNTNRITHTLLQCIQEALFLSLPYSSLHFWITALESRFSFYSYILTANLTTCTQTVFFMKQLLPYNNN